MILKFLTRRSLSTRLFVFAVTGGCLDTWAASATELRYCLARSTYVNTVYMSSAFGTDEPMETLEAAFGLALDNAGIAHDSLQCPRGNSGAIELMRQDAIQYSHLSGMRVIEFNWTAKGPKS
jgi:hypothetical protein